MNNKKSIISLILFLMLAAYKFNMFSVFQPKSLLAQSSRVLAEKIDMVMTDTNWVTFSELKQQVDTALNIPKPMHWLYQDITKELFYLHRNQLYQLVFKEPIKHLENVSEWGFDTQGKFVAVSRLTNIPNQFDCEFINLSSMATTQTVRASFFPQFNWDSSKFYIANQNSILLYQRAGHTFHPVKTLTSDFLVGNNVLLDNTNFSLSFDPLKYYFISYYLDQNGNASCTVWDKDFNELKTFNAEHEPLFTPQGNLIIPKFNGPNKNIAYKKRADILSDHPTHIFNLPLTIQACCPDVTVFNGQEICAIAFTDYNLNNPQPIIVYNLATNKRMRKLGPFQWNDTYAHIEFSENGTMMASGTIAGNNVYLWDISRNFKQFILTGPTDTISGVSFNPQSTLLAATSLDANIYLWNIENATPELVSTITGHGQMGYLQFSKSPFAGGSTFGGCFGEEASMLRLFFFPGPDAFNLNQLLYLLTIAQAPMLGLSPDRMQQLKNSLQTDETLQEFREPWLRGLLLGLIDKL